ncbi:putative nucleotidyltransferase [Variovorax sp. SRS16]|nr:putative nucleotidyltransferase [Variovorax sp. SRS16]
MSKQEIAAAAARLVVEEGLEYGPAKRRALRDLGLPARTALPNNDEVEVEVRDYIQLYCADTQPKELYALRLLALEWMERMAQFRPHVGGAVWHGTATRLSDIYIQLFCDDSKSAEIALIDHHVDYEPRMVTGFHGEQVEALSVHAASRTLGEEIGVHLLVYDLDDLRGALKPDAQGRVPRGNLAALRRLIEKDTE